MSNIQELLNIIRTAIYGRDVRQAIHDAIRTCYDDGKAGAVDIRAREMATLNEAALRGEISAFEARSEERQEAFENETAAQIDTALASVQTQMDTFIAEHGTVTATLIEETTLYEANPASGPESQLVISQAQMAGYDYIDIYYKITGTYKRYARLTPDMLAGEINLDPIAYTNGEKSLIMYEPVLVPNEAGTKLTLSVKRWAWNGAASAAATLRAAPEPATGIYKVAGVKHITSSADKDAELTDLRIAPDGSVYQTAGEMIRAELATIFDILDEIGLYRDDDGDLCEED